MWICWDVVCVSIILFLSSKINNECMALWFKRERIEHKRYIQINLTTKQTIINSTWIDEHLALRRHKDSWTIQFAKTLSKNGERDRKKMKKKFLFWKEIHTLKIYKAYWNLNQEMLMKLHVYGTQNVLLKIANRHFFLCDVCIFVLLFYICLKWLCGKASRAKPSRAELSYWICTRNPSSPFRITRRITLKWIRI